MTVRFREACGIPGLASGWFIGIDMSFNRPVGAYLSGTISFSVHTQSSIPGVDSRQCPQTSSEHTLDDNVLPALTKKGVLCRSGFLA
jgi:hypothetical protein